MGLKPLKQKLTAIYGFRLFIIFSYFLSCCEMSGFVLISKVVKGKNLKEKENF